MNWPITAFFTASLRLDARHASTYIVRALVVTLLFLVLVLMRASTTTLGAPGLVFFMWIAYGNAIFILIGGLRLFSSVITEEKEAQTLGLLRMSGMSPVAILLGKSTSKLISASILLLVQLPFTVLAVTLGGVSLAQVWAVYAALLAHMVFVANAALLCSVVCRRTRGAAGLFLLFCILYYIAVPMVVAAGAAGAWWFFALLAVPCRAIVATSVFTSLGSALAGLGLRPIAVQAGASMGLGAVLFLLSWGLFGTFCREQKEGGPARGLVATGKSRFRALGTGRVWRNALAWKDFHFQVGGWRRALVKGILCALSIAFFCLYLLPCVPFVRVEALGVGLMIGVVLFTIAEVTLMAAGVFNKEMRWQTLSALVMLPGFPWGVIRGKLLGHIAALMPNLVVFVLGALLAPEEFGDAMDNIFESQALWPIGMFIVFLHLTLYLSVCMKRAGVVVAFIMLYAWFILLRALSFALFSRGLDDDFLAAIHLVGGVGLCILIQAAALRRLRTLAGRE